MFGRKEVTSSWRCFSNISFEFLSTRCSWQTSLVLPGNKLNTPNHFSSKHLSCKSVRSIEAQTDRLREIFFFCSFYFNCLNSQWGLMNYPYFMILSENIKPWKFGEYMQMCGMRLTPRGGWCHQALSRRNAGPLRSERSEGGVAPEPAETTKPSGYILLPWKEVIWFQTLVCALQSPTTV